MAMDYEKPAKCGKHPPFTVGQDFRGGRTVTIAYQGLVAAVAMTALSDYIANEDHIAIVDAKIAELKNQLREARQDPDVPISRLERISAKIDEEREKQKLDKSRIKKIKDFFDKRWRLFVGDSDPYVFLSLMREVSKTVTDADGKEIFLRQLIERADAGAARELISKALADAREARKNESVGKISCK